MSRYSLDYLREFTRIGFTDKRGAAWHADRNIDITQLPNHFPGAIPLDALIGDRGLFDFDVNESPVFVQVDGLMMPVDNRKAYVHSRTGAVLGIHSDGHVGHSYKKWCVDHLSQLTGGSVEFANAGLLANGAQAWVQIEMPENIEVPGGSKVRPFLLATTSFDGSIATTYKTGFTNVVCDNTYSMFMSEGGDVVKRKHTKNSEFDLLSAASVFGTLSLVADKVTADIEQLLSVDVSDSHWSTFVQRLAPIDEKSSKHSTTIAERKRQELTGLWRTDMRVAPWAGTAWGAVQAVNTYNEHIATVRRVDGFERKMNRAITGKTLADDKATLDLLGSVVGRNLRTMELISA